MNFFDRAKLLFLSENKITDIFDKTKDKNDDDKAIKMGFTDHEFFSTSNYQDSVYAATSDKLKLIGEYRVMASFPEVADAIDDICEEAITQDEWGEVVSLQIEDEKLANNKNVVKNLQKEFDYIVNDVLDYNDNAFTMFKRFYIEAELYGEMVINPNKKKEGIKKVVILPSQTFMVKYDQFMNVEGFKQKVDEARSGTIVYQDQVENGVVTFSSEQIAYVNSGIYDPERNLYYSYIERAKVAYRQLKWLEDALIIYRIVRAPQRLIYNVDVGNLPKKKAQEYLNSVIRKYKQKKMYNTETGEVDIGKATMSMTEDFWLPKRADGSGTSIESIGGDADFVQHIDDIMYFVKKLYKALKIPVKRLEETSNDYYPAGREGEITQEEIKFSKYVLRIRGKFSDFLMQIFERHLKLKGLWDQYKLDKSKISIIYNEENEWRETKKLNNLNARIETFSQMAEYSPGDESNIFSNEYLMKNILKLTDEEIDEMQKQIEKEKKEMEDDEGEGEENPRAGDAGGFGQEEEPEEEPEKEPEGGEEEEPEESIDLLKG